MLRQLRLPLGPGLHLLIAVDSLLRPPELLRPVLKRLPGRRVEPLAGVRRPPRPIRGPSRPGNRRSDPDASNPEMLEFALSQEATRTASLLPPVEGRVENLMLPFISVPPLAHPHIQRKSNFLFLRVFRSTGRQCATHCLLTLARDPFCQRPRERAVRGRSASPRTSCQSPLGPREFRMDAAERAAFCTIQLYSPSLHHRRYVDCTAGATCAASGSVACAAQSVSLAHAHNSTRLRDSVRQATSQVQRRSRDFGGSSERSCLARGDCCPPGKGCNRAGPSSRDEAGVLQPLLHRTQERRWSSTNPGFATPEPGPAQAHIQDVDAQAYNQMHTAPGLVCSDRPEGCLLSCFDPSSTQTVPTVCVRRSGVAVQGPSNC